MKQKIRLEIYGGDKNSFAAFVRWGESAHHRYIENGVAFALNRGNKSCLFKIGNIYHCGIHPAKYGYSISLACTEVSLIYDWQ